MIHIYLCDDNRQQLSYWEKVISRWLIMQEADMKLYCISTSPSELLAARRASDQIGLYFLDIDLKSDKNGLELAQDIRRYDPRGYIVFITTHGEQSMLTFQYKVEAMDFILKDEPERLGERICECLKAAEENYQKQLDRTTGRLLLKIDNSVFSIDRQDIVLITTLEGSHRIAIHTLNGLKQMTGSIKELLPLLDGGFCQCSRSVIVNLKHVKEYQQKQGLLLMENQETCKVSMRMASKFLNTWNVFCGNQ